MVGWSGIKAELNGVFTFFLPPACLLCGRELPVDAPPDQFCSRCLAEITPLRSPCCPHCALPYPTENGTDHLCENCLRRPPAFSWVIAAGLYGGALREAIHRFKYQGAISLDLPLGKMLVAAISAQRPDFPFDLLVPVPLHKKKLRQRSYNQALLLARRIGCRWRIPVATCLLVRHRATTPQQGLALNARRQNLHNAFGLAGNVHGKKILLIDDVLTTGTTVDECARVLKDGGAAEIGVAVLGRVPRGELLLP